MTLEEAIEAFDWPTDKQCADLLRAACEAYRTEKINLNDMINHVERVAEWLADE